MRLIHTADWHLGRKLKGIDRTPELEAALDELLHQAQLLSADAILIAGDLFDTPNPTTEAERVAYTFFAKLEAAGIPAVLIAGNHDSAHRIDGIASLLSLVGVHALGTPRRADQGGLVTVETMVGDLCVGALPFANERKLLSADHLWDLDDQEQRQQYRTMVAALLQDLTRGFRDDSVNILMAHFATDQCRLTHSEVPLYSTGAYSLLIKYMKLFYGRF
jgi:exonuclease SbcD